MRWLLVVCLLLACSGEEQSFSFPDASFVEPDAGPVPYYCDETTDVSNNFNHCGACGQGCTPADADRCFSGECHCGVQGSCTPGSDCRLGNCYDSDPDGHGCEFDENCVAGYACIEGHCSFISCVEETCDGADNDCDSIVDEGSGGPLAGWCIGTSEAVPGSILPPCAIGSRLCVDGVWGPCIGDLAPTHETGLLACDGVDNDCDGCADGVMTSSGFCESREPRGFDVLFLIDDSGSMSSKIALVREAVRLFSTRLSGSSSINYGIVRIPGSTTGTFDLYQDLTTFGVFATTLAGMPIGSGGTEPQWNAIIASLDGSLGISWTTGYTRILILFTDENGQRFPTTEADMCAAVTESGAVLISVVTSGYASDFDDCSYRNVELLSGSAGSGDRCSSDSDCGAETCGSGRCVSDAVLTTVSNLELVISDPCG